MPEVIRLGQVETDPWHYLGAPPLEDLSQALPPGALVVPLAAWKERRAELVARGEALGVWLKPDDDPGELALDFAALSLIAVHFPKFTDGRGYSTATLLRGRHGYRGELRAFGDVGRDQLFYLSRCGFDAFRLADHRDPHQALASLRDFRFRYQGSADDPRPLFRQRAASQTPT
ncbi:MAG TPA: DUF934 domain-containing protein [Usitatibacter sp.]|nr:DUF934 domain-containing protein [Usitatibacter sp.]